MQNWRYAIHGSPSACFSKLPMSMKVGVDPRNWTL